LVGATLIETIDNGSLPEPTAADEPAGPSLFDDEPPADA
jgi:hypothetical protein